MKRILLSVTAIAAALVLPASAIAARPTVKLAGSDHGKILVSGANGFTLYAFSKDKRNKDNCAKIAGCLGVWPPLTVKGKPTGGPGVKASLLGTIKLSGGKLQVTYAGWPLYLYKGDSGPAQTSYINFFQFGGTWPGLNAAGKWVK